MQMPCKKRNYRDFLKQNQSKAAKSFLGVRCKNEKVFGPHVENTPTDKFQ